MRPTSPYKVAIYRTKDGRLPYEEWFNGLDSTTQAIVDSRIKRVSMGNLGDCKAVDGVLELRIFHGPGIRVYMGIVDKVLILLLCGGDKSTQKKDIKRAKIYLKDYREPRR
jgi:putative addiction module killer protein